MRDIHWSLWAVAALCVGLLIAMMDVGVMRHTALTSGLATICFAITGAIAWGTLRPGSVACRSHDVGMLAVAIASFPSWASDTILFMGDGGYFIRLLAFGTIIGCGILYHVQGRSRG